MRNSNKGFTLIELLVVIAIIGLLSTLAVVALNSARQRSRDAKRVADIRQIQTALELSFSETNAYPTEATAVTLGTGDQLVLCNDAGTPEFRADSTTAGNCDAPGTVFMGLVPSNPTPNGANYQYTSAAGADYSITFTLEGATGQLAAGARTATQDGIN